MIKSYQSYIKLLKEAKLQLNNEFILILKVLAQTDVVAHTLLSLYNSDFDFPEKELQSFINLIPGKDDMVSFLPQSKYNQDSNPYTQSRNEIKIGRLVKHLLSIADYNHTDKEIELFVNKFKALNSEHMKSEFKLVSGENIRKYYHYESYVSISGELGNSCMRYTPCQEYFDIYVQNPDKIQLLILIENEKILGRALVWKLDESPSETKIFMDRVYTIKNSDRERFFNYADNKGWMRKSTNGMDFSEGVSFIYNRNILHGRVSVSLNAKLNKYPFMDTICFVNDERSEISNIGYDDGYVFSSTSGAYARCHKCYGKGFIYCRRCEKGCNECTEGKKSCPDCVGILEKVLSNLEK